MSENKKTSVELIEIDNAFDPDKLTRLFLEKFGWIKDYDPQKDFDSPSKFGKYMINMMYVAFQYILKNAKDSEHGRRLFVNMMIGAKVALDNILKNENIESVLLEVRDQTPPPHTMN